MPKLRHTTYFEGPERIYTCSNCHSHIAKHGDVISRAFQGRYGPAFLVTSVVNVTLGTKEERMLMTGMHTVADITCNICNARLGWKYLHAAERQQKYKEGRYIVEKVKVSREVPWETD